MRTASQEYWDKQPCNIKHSKALPGSEDFYWGVRNKRYFVESHVWSFMGAWRWHGKKVLEVGCGIGVDSIQFAYYGAEVLAVDSSQVSIDVARKTAESLGLKNINFHRWKGEHLSWKFNQQEYDLIYCFGVLHHCENPNEILWEMRRFAGPKTKFKIMLYNRYSIKMLESYLSHIWKTWNPFNFEIKKYTEAQQGCPIAKAYSKKDVRKLFNEVGLNVDSIKIDHLFPWKFPEYKENKYVKKHIYKLIPEFLYDWLKRHFGWHLLIEGSEHHASVGNIASSD